jgi:lipopolysaccharide transport system permease protein
VSPEARTAIDPTRARRASDPATLLPFSFLQSGWKHRRLILRLTRGRIDARYRGSLLGGLWVAILPLLMLGVYTFVFSVVLRARWSGAGAHAGEAHFALVLFSGLILFSIFAECINEAPGLMQASQNYIKQVMFPSEVLAWVSLGAALWRFVVSLVLLLVFYVAVIGAPPLASLTLLLDLVPVILLTLGGVWLLASLGVFLRDLAQFVSVITAALLFLSPIFYPASRVPAAFQPYLYLNPFCPILEGSRRALFEAQLPDWGPLALVTGIAWLTAWMGYAWFMRTKSSFADVL